VALNGIFVRFTSTAGNDPMFWLAVGGMLLFALRIHGDPGNWRAWAGFALCAVLGIYTKLATLIVMPVLLLEPLGLRSRRALLNALLLLSLIALCTLPIWWRNVHEFGSVVPLGAGFGQPAWRFPTLSSLAFAVRSFVFPWTEYWKSIGGMVLMLPALYVLARGCILRSGWRILVEHKPVGLLMVAAIVSFLWLNLRYDQAESRYLCAAWPSLIMLGIGKRNTQQGLWLLFVVLLLPYVLFVLP